MDQPPGAVPDELLQRLQHFHSQYFPLHQQRFQDLVAQRSVIRKLLTCLARVELYRFHQTVNVTFKHDAVVNHSRDFIDNLWGREAGIRNHSDTE